MTPIVEIESEEFDIWLNIHLDGISVYPRYIRLSSDKKYYHLYGEYINEDKNDYLGELYIEMLSKDNINVINEFLKIFQKEATL